MSTTQSFGPEEFEARFDDLSNLAVVEIEFTSSLVGGQPATDAGLEAYVLHHLQLRQPNPEWTEGQRKIPQWILSEEGREALARIKREEIGSTNITPDDGELEERLVYAVNVLRRTDGVGPYLGDWQLKACLKQAASRLGFFVSKRGSKGDMAEMGRVAPAGDSVVEGNDHHIHLLAPDGHSWEDREWIKLLGCVHTPQGRKPIVTDTEIAPVGTRAVFTFQWPANSKLDAQNVLDTFAAAQNCGLGSARSLEHGRFKILKLDLTMAERRKK